MTNENGEKQCEIGIVGLGVMGRNLLLNMADHGFVVAGLIRMKIKSIVYTKNQRRNDVYGTTTD